LYENFFLFVIVQWDQYCVPSMCDYRKFMHSSPLVPNKLQWIGVREIHLNSTYFSPAWHSFGRFISRGSITMVSNLHTATFEQVTPNRDSRFTGSIIHLHLHTYTCFLCKHIAINASTNTYSLFVSLFICTPTKIFMGAKETLINIFTVNVNRS